MNRFEALHTLGLEETASDEEVRLAYYGIEKAVKAGDYDDVEAIQSSVRGLLDRAKQAREFLLNERNKAAARQVMEKGGKSRNGSKLAVTATEERYARLNGFERVRLIVVGYLDDQRGRRNMSLGVIALCIVVSFIVLRYVRAMQPRIIVFAVIAIAAIASSTVLTTSMMQVKKTKPHMIAIDEKIDGLKRQLGVSDVAGEESQEKE